jgi:DNA-binding response OmpR family regulator
VCISNNPAEREKVMVTLNTQVSELQAATTDRILVIAHDNALQKILFSSEGYEVNVVSCADAALDLIRQRPPSAVILDLPYAESSGCHLCRTIANLIPGQPVVILCASSDVADKVRHLQAGAKDCGAIPFSPKELVDRLHALRLRETSRRIAVCDELEYAERSNPRGSKYCCNMRQRQHIGVECLSAQNVAVCPAMETVKDRNNLA